MVYQKLFSKLIQSPPFSSALLPLTLMPLEEWGVVTVTGADSQPYLQGQVTADINLLGNNQHVLAAHCDAKGKVWSNLRLFHRHDGFSYIARHNLLEMQLTELKKYAVFSKVTLTEDKESILLGIAGKKCRESLSVLFPSLPDAANPVVQLGSTTLLYFFRPAERFLLVTDVEMATELIEKLRPSLNDSQQWLALDIEAGFPVIEAATSAQFTPQAINLQAIEGSISFDKGMYMGLATIARTKYRGVNKRAMYWLAGSSGYLPVAGDELEWQLGASWRRTGTILSAVKMADNTIWIQVVMNNDMNEGNIFRLYGDEGHSLTIQPLPYLLNSDTE
ncbi:tRNA-modifying protein YgfZ [Xenorhabdus szentirmaii]|uniref:tRNA-modifying protein YgfZ n=1 Tax=Xenorhabdus szentirmaii TaxID=290112 RepID=UPI0019975860|nr:MULTISPECIES: tRNA-modifying protein YgfZ [unclassified Xenorhabdus]MBD2793953.1 tRNA-modifying protein YgfZ [Xenorhabdus sp. CUL]MBD2826452.1 tRNA-modifying protein YgfZ [Xenorhabdus sp. 5]